MFAKNKVSQSMIDAVNTIMSEKEVEIKSELLNEAEKVPTATGMKVYGSSYGDSQKARKDQLKSNVDDVKEPSTREITGKDPDLKYKKDTGQKRNYRVHAGRYFSNMDANKSSKGREEPRYKNEEVEVAEELKGNQHKIDKNKNNKIDAQDFKMLRKEELKGNQHKIDANKNNKIDAHDFQLLRGKKKVKEDTFAGKLLNSLAESEEIQKAINEVMKKDSTAGDWIHDFVHSKNPKFAGKSTKERQKMALGAYYAKQNEEVEELAEKEGTGGSDPLANRQDYAKRHGTGQVYKKTHPGDKTGMTKSFAYDIKRSGPKGKLPEEVESLDEKDPCWTGYTQVGMKKKGGRDVPNCVPSKGVPKATGYKEEVEQVEEASTYKLGRADAETKEFPIKQNGEHVGRLEFHVSAGKLHHRAGNAKDVSYDKWHGNPNTESLVNAHVAKHEAEARKYFAKKLKEEVELDEAAPKKMDDVAKQNLTPAKKGVVGTVKSDFKNFKNFLAGKPETNEAVNPTNTTIDTLAGRSKKVPKEAKIDNGHSSAKVELKSEEVEQLDEDRWLMKYLLSKGINPEFVNRNQKVAHAKSNDFKKYRRDHQQMQGEEVQSEAAKSPIFRPKPTDYNNATKARARRNTGLPFAGPYTKVSADPMQRARSMAQSAMQSVKDKQNQPTTMDKVKSAVDKTKKVATKTFMTAFKP